MAGRAAGGSSYGRASVADGASSATDPFVVGAPGTAKPPSDERAAAELDEGGGRELSAERSCLDLLRVLQHRGEAEARDFVARLQRSAGGGGLEAEPRGPAAVLPALGGTALRKAASASKSLLPDPSSFLPTALGSKLSDVVKKAGR